MTRSKEDPRASVAQSLFSLYLNTQDGDLFARPEDLAYARSVVLGAMATNHRKYWQALQNTLADASPFVANTPSAVNSADPYAKSFSPP